MRGPYIQVVSPESGSKWGPHNQVLFLILGPPPGVISSWRRPFQMFCHFCHFGGFCHFLVFSRFCRFWVFSRFCHIFVILSRSRDFDDFVILRSRAKIYDFGNIIQDSGFHDRAISSRNRVFCDCDYVVFLRATPQLCYFVMFCDSPIISSNLMIWCRDHESFVHVASRFKTFVIICQSIHFASLRQNHDSWFCQGRAKWRIGISSFDIANANSIMRFAFHYRMIMSFLNENAIRECYSHLRMTLSFENTIREWECYLRMTFSNDILIWE